ncbi:lachesin-like [Hemiscyllium ocellatum]|uniref:lachesin-like n=1 Tax=Hemiscyllium ocellatum TaxID=170820 RepID=UPI0029672E0A|nr:lachesin-like [Hemiscyllium ocellatum]
MMCRVLWVMVLSLCVALGMMTNPKIILSPSRIMVAVGSSVQLQCAIVNGSVQHLGVTWNMVTSASSPEILTHSQSDGVTKGHSNNKKFQSFRDLKHSSYILTIKDIETSDNRQYYCDIVGKNMSKSSQRIAVSVQGMMTNPKIILSPSRIMVAVGSSVQLQCAIVNGSVQHLGVTWNMVTSASSPEILTHSQSDGVTKGHSNNKKFQSFRDLKHSSYILTIKDIETSDNRQYYCDIVGKNMSKSSQRIAVSVQGKSFPVLTQTPILNVTVSQTAQLHCSVQNIDLGESDVHWYRRSLAGYQWIVMHRVSGNVLVNKNFQGHFNSTRNNSGLVATLIITNIQPEDATVYYCNVWSNVYGTGTQLNIITFAEAEIPDLLLIFLGRLLVLLLFLIVAVIVLLNVNQKACFTSK